MKKNLLNLFTALALIATCMNATAQKRYVDEVFANVLKTANIEYDSNRSINIFPPNTPPIITTPLRCDIYQPVGDTAAKRPLIILASTGSYLPAIINQQPTGNKNDSSIVELANRLSKRGYVVMAVNYRLGWNPNAASAAATEQLIKATYRAIQDVRNAIRFMRVNAGTYKIDTSRIVVGGQGTGGYVALGLAAVSSKNEIEGRLKFQRGDFSPMVSVDTLGDWNGIGGAPFFNYGGDASVSGNAHMVFNYGGAMGDTSWMDNATLPIIGLHCPTDRFAPYKTGNVIVPTTGVTVINSASGAGDVIPLANSLGINNKMNAGVYNDAITARALTITGGVKNLYPFISNFPAEGSPWEWWDRLTVQGINFPSAGAGRNADSLAMITNPFMSAARAKAYIDTIVQFISPRIYTQLDLQLPPPTPDTLNYFELVSPPNNSNVVVKSDSTKNITIKWSKSSSPFSNLGNITYEWILASSAGNFNSPVLNISTGTADSLVLTEKAVYDVLANASVPVDVVFAGKWTVRAKLGSSSLLAQNFYNINLTRTNDGVGFNEIAIANAISLYPNPAKENVTVSMDKGQAVISQVNVFDITGKVVLTQNAVSAHQVVLNTENLTKGIYLVNVKLANGASATKRLAIQ
jgi:acetyl esterase/lipase